MKLGSERWQAPKNTIDILQAPKIPIYYSISKGAGGALMLNGMFRNHLVISMTYTAARLGVNSSTLMTQD